MDVQNRIVGIAGRKGSGKSTVAREILEHCDRLFMLDMMGEHVWIPEKFERLDDAVIFLLESPNRGQFWARYIPQDDDEDGLEAEFSEICSIVYDQGNMLLAVEEVPSVSSPNYAPRKFSKLIRLGRHRNVSIVYTAQRLGECPRKLTAATDVFVLFNTTEPLDLDAIAKRCGQEIARKVTELGLHGFIVYDAIEKREISTAGDLWYASCVQPQRISIVEG